MSATIEEAVNSTIGEQQRTADWFAQRLGNVTASRVADVERTAKGEWTAKAMTYAYQLVAERITGSPSEHFVTAAMRWGTDHETDVVAAFTTQTGITTEGCGYIAHPTIPRFGASPDRVVRAPDGVVVGILETKCPESWTMIRWAQSAKIPEQHMDQVVTQMMCTGAQAGHFFAFDPRLIGFEGFSASVTRADVEPRMSGIEARVVAFLEMVSDLEHVFRSRVKGGGGSW